MSSHPDSPMKIKVIVTQFVQTNEAGFKSLVQSLTGMESDTAGEAGGMTREIDGGEGEDGDGGGRRRESPPWTNCLTLDGHVDSELD
ncbi:hypothetical protein HPP92_000598 [Vanilla planifolia]|uniref:VQ domain-containing protein n=1 Tax=Vanilla planifolia TaxID=51239 RepID=A0A835VEJ6_VANPL|nr:hypothetical protein HPP92_000598 [Vanilla planifolia]